MEQFLETATNILMPVVLALISLGASYAILYLNKAKARIQLETEKIQDAKQKALVESSIDSLDKLLEQTILLAESTLVREIKGVSKDNKLTLEEGKYVAETVTNTVLDQLNKDTKELLKTQSNSLESYIRSEVEVVLARLKNKSDEIRG